MNDFGLLPEYWYSLAWPLVALALWRLLLPTARRRQLIIFHNANIQVSFWEEILFRGLVLGGFLFSGLTPLASLILSSLLFGIFHFRNLWWTDWRRCLGMALPAALLSGPLFATSRLITGDIYLGILLHFLWNATFAFVPLPFKNLTGEAPTDDEIAQNK